MSYKHFILLVTIIATSIFTKAQETPAFILDSLDAYIEKAMLKWQVPGVAVGIVKDGEIVVEKGYGVLNLDTKEQVNKNSLFMIGSNTKAFTGTALTLLEHEGKCKLEDKVVDYVPEFKMYHSEYTPMVNLIDIVSHRLGYETFQGDFMYFDSDMTEGELLEKMSKVKPVYDFRTKYGYCNEGYTVAGMAIKKMTGKSWDAYLKEKIINPLGMNNTLTKVSEMELAENACKGYTLDKFVLSEIGYGGLDLLGPAASISSSVHDMNKWTSMLLNKGVYNDVEVLPEKVIERSRYPQTFTGNGRHTYNKNNFKLYALGWGISDYESYKVVAHTGGVHGFVTGVTLVPEINLGIVVLTNTDHNWLYDALKWEIMDAFLGLQQRNYSDVYHGWFTQSTQKDSLNYLSLRDSVELGLKPQLSLKKFAGDYKSDVYGTVQLKANAKVIDLSFEHHPDLNATLEYIGNDRFLCTYSNAAQGVRVFPFVIEDKEVKSFTLSVASYLEYTTYEFKKVD